MHAEMINTHSVVNFAVAVLGAEIPRLQADLLERRAVPKDHIPEELELEILVHRHAARILHAMDSIPVVVRRPCLSNNSRL